MIVAAPYMEGAYKFSGLLLDETYKFASRLIELGQASPWNQGGRHPKQESIYSRCAPKRFCDR